MVSGVKLVLDFGVLTLIAEWPFLRAVENLLSGHAGHDA